MILEVGPLDCPTYTKKEANVRYLDWYTSDELKERASRDSRRNIAKIDNVDYVVKAKRFSDHIPEKFDLFIANHVIEHIPDIIAWLQEIENILSPGGFVFLSIPDRRYTFDYLRRETTITDLLRCYDLDLYKPDVWQIFDAMYYHRNIVRKDLDSGTYKEKLQLKSKTVSETLSIAKRREKSYVSLHCSVFSFTGFASLYRDIEEAKLIGLKIVAINDVLPNAQEFHVLLQKPEEIS